jgi:hypothetical protein
MRTIIAALIVLIGIGSAGAAWASFESGSSLLEKNQKDKPYLYGVYRGYIVGVVDSNNNRKYPTGFCFSTPPGVNVGQLDGVVTKWLEKHPEHLHLSADSLVVASLTEVWPCKK